MRPLFIVRQIRTDPIDHNHNKCAVIHIHAVSPTNKLVRTVPVRTNCWGRRLGLVHSSESSMTDKTLSDVLQILCLAQLLHETNGSGNVFCRVAQKLSI
jgi:hypothetical protein